MTEHRWSKFWWQDYERDPALRMCSLAAQGLWMRMLCFMHEGEPYGHLTVNAKAPSARQLASIVSAPEKEVSKLLEELEDAGVFNRSEAGTIYCRRMVRDKQVSEEAKENGRKGGNPKLKGDTSTPDNRTVKPPGKPQGLTLPLIHQEAEAESESEAERKLATASSKTPRENSKLGQPCRSDPPDRWALQADGWSIDERGTRRPTVNGYFLDVVADLVCQAAGINDANWRGDWRPLIGWLKADILSDVIIETIRQVAARPGYKPPASLAYFDKPVRERAGLECAA